LQAAEQIEIFPARQSERRIEARDGQRRLPDENQGVAGRQR